VQFTKDDLLEISNCDQWMNPSEFEDMLRDKHGDKSPMTLLVPTLAPDRLSCLRFKKVQLDDLKDLQRLQGFESVEFDGASYVFGREPKDLNHRHSRGVLLSSWGRDPLVTKLQLEYDFGKACVEIFGKGYGDRNKVPCHGSNIYTKPSGRGTAYTQPSPAQAHEEMEEQQYSMGSKPRSHLMAPWARKQLNELSTNMLHFAGVHNPR
jgi:hypothetical protein